MTLGSYLTFVSVAFVVVLVPGADFAITMRNTLVGGRTQGWATAFGISAACAAQGAAAVLGLSALILASQPVFTAISWAGVGYLAFLAAQAAWSAWRGQYPPLTGLTAKPSAGFRQGFLSNITNPKVLVFYLAVLPHSLGSGLSWSALPVALTHAVLALVWLGILAAVVARAAPFLQRRAVRRTLDAATASVLGAFSLSLARSQL